MVRSGETPGIIEQCMHKYACRAIQADHPLINTATKEMLMLRCDIETLIVFRGPIMPAQEVLQMIEANQGSPVMAAP